MTAERRQRLMRLRLIDEAFADYLSGLVALRKRVVDGVRRKLNDGTVPDRARQGARSRSGRARKRG